jgi:acetyl esterase/lipase
VRRVVFVATPHRGSYRALGFFGDLASWFVNLPGTLTRLTIAFATLQARGVLAGPFTAIPTAITQGEKNFTNAPRFATASVINYVTADFPPAFISAGNADPLLPQSRAFADVLARRGVHVERLFFPDDYKPVLPHEYQFDLDTDAGQLALERSIEFLSAQ